ncbi:MAG: hypothetical protein OXC14_18215 [Rhodospirillaceae bacterium]|nr:hypothetical protein [Rhodospirillaceae bacterium]
MSAVHAGSGALGFNSGDEAGGHDRNRRLEGPSARLEQVDLRKVWVWSREAEGFTPWLAQPENLDLLRETLGLTLEVEAVEKALGSFRADIVCREEAGSHVLIENRLERTKHDHLGKLLTYVASLEAVTVVWLAATFREERRAVLDWLNRITPDVRQRGWRRCLKSERAISAQGVAGANAATNAAPTA